MAKVGFRYSGYFWLFGYAMSWEYKWTNSTHILKEKVEIL